MLSVANDTRSKGGGAAATGTAYDPMAYRPLTFFDAVPRFGAGEDDPRRYLERCLEVIATRELVVKAWVVLNERVIVDLNIIESLSAVGGDAEVLYEIPVRTIDGIAKSGIGYHIVLDDLSIIRGRSGASGRARLDSGRVSILD